LVAVKHAFSTPVTTQVSSSSTTYTTVASIAAAATTTGNDYIIFAKADIAGSSNSVEFKARLVRGGSTLLTGSEALIQPAASDPTHGLPWSYVFLLENIPNETIDFQIAVSTTGTVYADNIVIAAIDLEDDEAAAPSGLVRGADWDYAQNTTTNGHIGSFGVMTAQESLTLNVASGDVWLVAGCAQIAVNDTSISYRAQIFLDTSEGTVNHPGYVMEGEDTNEQRLSAMLRVYEGLSVGPHLWVLQTGDDAAPRSGPQNAHLFSSLFAINLALFSTGATDYQEAQIAVALAPAVTEVANTGAFTPGATGGGSADDFLTIGYANGRVLANNVQMRSYLKDSVSGFIPTGSEENSISSSYDSTDHMPLVTMSVDNWAAGAGARTLTLGANSSSAGKTQGDRCIVAWPMELASGAPPDTTLLPTPAFVDLAIPSPSLDIPQSVAPAPAVLDLVVTAPTVTLGAITQAPAPAVLDLVVTAPTVTLGTLTLAPAPAVLDVAVPAPFIDLGAASPTTLNPAVVALPIVVTAPTVALGTKTLLPSPAVLDLAVTAPEILLTNVLSPGVTVLDLVVTAPTIGGNLTVSPGAAALDLGIPGPTIDLGAAPGVVFVNSGNAVVEIDVSQFASGTVFYFAAVLSNDNVAHSGRAHLYNLTTAAPVLGSEVTITGAVLDGGNTTDANWVISSSFNLTGKRRYIGQHRVEALGQSCTWHASYVIAVSS
jgi:hypothetical protein